MDEFEVLLETHRTAVERFVHFRLSGISDADDVLQDIFLTAFQKFPQLKNKDAFRAWIIRIARNKCNDHFRALADPWEIPIETLSESALSDGRLGPDPSDRVADVLDQLTEQDRQILSLYFWQELSHPEIARQLGIPLGTVKSRLHNAKARFRQLYPAPSKGGPTMKKLPKYIPGYHIEPSAEAPFPVKWEELMGWFLVPRLGEKLSWAMYDMPSRKCSHIYDMKVTGKAKVHGIEGVELTAREASCSDKQDVTHRTFVAQLTDTHCRYLATLRNDGDVRNYITFLDGEEFLPNWGFGEDNCGNEINLSPKGHIRRHGDVITTENQDFLLDIVGRYTVTIGGKQYDTVCVLDIETYNCGVVSEQFLDRNGRTILWRRFNRNDWAMDRYGKPWTELLPDNDRLTVNGTTYVQWYDCITDYIL